MSCLALGYSSWIAGDESNNNVDIDLSIGEVNKQDFGDAAYYVKNSENYFSYYSVDDANIANTDSISIKIKINPSLIVESVKEESNISFGLTYSFRTSFNRLLFESNSYCSLYEHPIFCLSNNKEIAFEGGIFEYLVEDIGNSTTRYTINSKTMLYSKEEDSLRNFFKHFGTSGEVSLDVFFKFEIYDYTIFKNMTTGLEINVLTSLGGK